MMNSLEWRVRKLENKILGHKSNRLPIYETPVQEQSIVDRLEQVARVYKNFNDINGDKYANFTKLYNELTDKLSTTNNDISESAKAELVLAYADDLTRHLETYKLMVEKADRVLDIKGWPDLDAYDERLSKLEKITKEQHLQSVSMDKDTEKLIEIYNDILGSLKNNMSLWNQRLELFENEERVHDEDVSEA